MLCLFSKKTIYVVCKKTIYIYIYIYNVVALFMYSAPLPGAREAKNRRSPNQDTMRGKVCKDYSPTKFVAKLREDIRFDINMCAYMQSNN